MGYAIGIDLGTSNCCVGVFRDGKVEIIPNECGNRTTPSVVAFSDTGRVYGDAAKSQATLNPTKTTFAALRLVGRKFHDLIGELEEERWPFTILCAENGRPQISIIVNGERRLFYPEEIDAMMLTKLKESAETFLQCEVTNAVITAPVNLNYCYHQAIIDAASIAGLNVLRVVNAPTAAAIAYVLDNKPSTKRNMLVFDFGGGTLDVSILTNDRGKIKVIITGSNHHLGGEDVNNMLLDFFDIEFERRYGKDFKDTPRNLRWLLTECERVKHELSSVSQAFIETDKLVDGNDCIVKIARPFYEGFCCKLFDSTLETVQKALKDAKMTREQIDDVILVGGSTCIPMIQTILGEFFNRENSELARSINPDEAVACGAAIQAALLSDVKSENIRGLLLPNVVPFTLGIINEKGAATPFIKRNTVLPVKVAKTVIIRLAAGHQPGGILKIYEGESKVAEEVKVIGELKLIGTPRISDIEIPFDVTFEINHNGTLTVLACDKSTGKVEVMTIPGDDCRFSKEDLKRIAQNTEELKRIEKDNRERVVAMNKLEDFIKNKLLVVEENKRKRKLDEEKDTQVFNKCKKTRRWLNSHPAASYEELEQQLAELEEVPGANQSASSSSLFDGSEM